MPRFGLKTLLIGFVVVALWMSTFPRFYEGSEDVRDSLKVLIVVASAIAAYCLEGRQRIFWMGFAATWIWCELGKQGLAPSFTSLVRVFQGDGRVNVYNTAIADTVKTCGKLILASIAGLISVYIYDQSRSQK
jgi:hypothetical protein